MFVSSEATGEKEVSVCHNSACVQYHFTRLARYQRLLVK